VGAQREGRVGSDAIRGCSFSKKAVVIERTGDTAHPHKIHSLLSNCVVRALTSAARVQGPGNDLKPAEAHLKAVNFCSNTGHGVQATRCRKPRRYWLLLFVIHKPLQDAALLPPPPQIAVPPSVPPLTSHAWLSSSFAATVMSQLGRPSGCLEDGGMEGWRDGGGGGGGGGGDSVDRWYRDTL